MAGAVDRTPAPGLVEVASGLEPYAAHIARGRLEAEGIPALVLDDQLQNPHGVYEASPRARIRVAAEHADAARAILHADYSSDLERLAEQASELAEPPELPAWPRSLLIALLLAFACAVWWAYA